MAVTRAGAGMVDRRGDTESKVRGDLAQNQTATPTCRADLPLPGLSISLCFPGLDTLVSPGISFLGSFHTQWLADSDIRFHPPF